MRLYMPVSESVGNGDVNAIACNAAKGDVYVNTVIDVNVIIDGCLSTAGDRVKVCPSLSLWASDSHL